MTRQKHSLLESIQDPTDVRQLAPSEVDALAGEIRRFLIEKVCATGGHLGPNLGAVELTIALHRVFRSPRDTILFDTGHQAYVHKLLTGRMKQFTELRQAGGLSGYPSRAESVHDVIENSHASTALAYADGLAKAYRLSGYDDRQVVAVVGDGALTGGMAWEALNNLATSRRQVIVVLNDNGHSYSPTVGGIAHHLAGLRAGCGPGNLFETLGLAYVGPVDGHDEPACEGALRQAGRLRRPAVVHCVTRKGHGYPPAAAEHELMHTVPVSDPATGLPTTSPRTWTEVFAEQLCALGEDRRDLVAVTAAMPGPTGLAAFGERFPDRLFDVGIAEQQALTSAAGMAIGGLHPVVAVYATFLNRAFDQLLLDVALHRLPVTVVCDRAGITGPDGPSHHGIWDGVLAQAVPGLQVALPRDPARLRELLREAVAVEGCPTLVRFPKSTVGPDLAALARVDGVDFLHRSARRSRDVLLVSYGPLAGACLAAAAALAADGLGVTVVDPRWAWPVSPALTHEVQRHRVAVTVEDGVRSGGFGAALALACADAGVTTPVRGLGLPRAFIDHGSRSWLLSQHALDADGIRQRVLRLVCAVTAVQATQPEGDHRTPEGAVR